MRQAICYLYSFVFALICMFRLAITITITIGNGWMGKTRDDQEGIGGGGTAPLHQRSPLTADIFACAQSKYQTVPGMAN